MTPSDRLALFERDLRALMNATDGMLLFNVVGDEDSYIQFSQRAGEPLFCEVSNRSEGWNTHSMNRPQVEKLVALGYEIPSPHHQANPNKNYSGDAGTLATEVENIFRAVFGLADDYEVESSGIFS
jgi:hypothetical protein